MSEHKEVMEAIKLLAKEIYELKQKVENKDTTPAILNIETFTKYFYWSSSTQAKWRTSKDVVENLPYNSVGGVTYVTKEVEAFMKRHRLNKS